MQHWATLGNTGQDRNNSGNVAAPGFPVLFQGTNEAAVISGQILEAVGTTTPY